MRTNTKNKFFKHKNSIRIFINSTARTINSFWCFENWSSIGERNNKNTKKKEHEKKNLECNFSHAVHLCHQFVYNAQMYRAYL